MVVEKREFSRKCVGEVDGMKVCRMVGEKREKWDVELMKILAGAAVGPRLGTR